MAQWLKEDLRGMLLDAFNKDKIEREGIFNYSYIDGMIKEFLGNRNDTRKEIWALYAHGDLTLETELTGRFRQSSKAVDLKSVMREIDDTRAAEEARLVRMAEAKAS